jgi:DUF4097 and DUF4098 domain-containing protein YvlB
MKLPGKKTWVLLALVVLLVATPALLAFSTDTGSFERVLTVSEPVDMHVQTGSGNIEVRVGEPGDVRVIGTIRVHRRSVPGVEKIVDELKANPPVEQMGRVVRIGNLDYDLPNHVSISYEVTVPVATTLDSRTGSGDQVIDGIEGPMEATSGSGDLKLSNIGSRVEIKTGSGDVQMAGVKGPVSITTGSGDIRAEKVDGNFQARTGSGDVILQQAAAGNVAFKTGSGDLRASNIRGALEVRTSSGDVEAKGEPSGAWSLRSASGDIELTVPSDATFDFHARTTSGDLWIDHPLTTQGKVSRHEIQGTVRGGGYLLDISTVSGDVRLD